MPETALVGRDVELRELLQLLAAHQHVTLTGAGGVGKTRLALAAAAAFAERPEVQVFVCPLAEVEGADAVRPAVAAHLGVRRPPGEPLGHALRAHGRGGAVLVALDNCEHVAAAAADVVTELLAAGPHLTVLATSREPLRLSGERVFALGPLPVPPSASDGEGSVEVIDVPAVRLFVERATAARADFRTDDVTLDAVARVCRAVDGLPLALEIAAAHVRSLAVADIADRLEQGADLPSTHDRRAPGRHRSLRAVVEWSFALLTSAEQAVFLELTLHSAGADLDTAVRAVADAGVPTQDAPDLLASLAGRCLLVLDAAPDGSTRYRMLETLRAYGLERLEVSGELAAARDRHADRYVAVAHQLRALGLREWSLGLAALWDEFDNIRSALTWCLEQDATPGRCFELLAPLWYVGIQLHADEVAGLCTRALDRWPGGADQEPLRAEVAATAAASLLVQEDAAGARRRAQEAVAAGRSDVGAAWGSRTLADIAYLVDGDPESGLGHLDRADAAAAAAGFEPLRCDLLGLRTAMLCQLGRDGEALRTARRALDLAERQGNVFERAWDLHLLGQLSAAARPREARAWLVAALEESRRIGYPYGTASSLRALGVVATVEGDPAEAARRFRDALDRFVRTGFRLERWNTVAALVPLLVAVGRREVAAVAAAGVARAEVVVERIVAPGYAEAVAALGPELGDPLIAARARALTADQLLAVVVGQLADLAGAAPVDDPSPTAGTVPRPRARSAAWTRSGSLWRLDYGGTTVHLPELKGLATLALLLERPGQDLAALDLVGDMVALAPATAVDDWSAGPPGDLGDEVDAVARAAYARRIRELQDDEEDAVALGDAVKASAARAEREAITEHLASAYGLHGPRRAGDPAEKARTTVTARIRAAIAKVAAVHPELGRHLHHSVRTGRFCSYRPDEPVAWAVDRGRP